MRLRTLAAFLVPIALACSGGTDTPPPTPAAVAPAKAVNIATLLTGGPAAVPGVFKGVVPGLPSAEALTRLPGLAQQAWFKDSAFGDLMFSVDIDADAGRVERIYFNLPAATAEELVTKAWGPPIKAKGPYSAAEKVLWWNPGAGVRANLGVALVDSRPLEFTRYTPTTTLLGPESPVFAFTRGNPLLGQSWSQLGAHFAESLVCSYTEGSTQLDVSYPKLATPFPPDASHSWYLELAPTEYGEYWTRVPLGFGEDGRVNRYRFAVPFEGNVPHRDAVITLVKHKFGTDGTAVEVYGKPMTRLADSPQVDLSIDSLGGTVEVQVETARVEGRVPGSRNTLRTRGTGKTNLRGGPGAAYGKVSHTSTRFPCQPVAVTGNNSATTTP